MKGSKYCVELCFVLMMTDFGSLNPELSSKFKFLLPLSQTWHVYTKEILHLLEASRFQIQR
jgi:hypothetical protein